MNYTAIVDAVDFASVLTGIGSVAALLAAVYVAIKGAKILLGFIR